MSYKGKTKQEYQHEWYQKNKESVKEYNKKWRKAHPEGGRRRTALYKKRHPDKVKQFSKNTKQRLKVEAFEKYSTTDPPECACCGEKIFEFFTIDHINGGGNKHRATEANPTNIYQWLRTNKYPQGFQVLCMNCNWAKGVYGICPHKRKK